MNTALAPMARRLWGMSPADAFDRSICLRCKQGVEVAQLSDIDRREYAISAICPICFAAIFPDEPSCDCHPDGPHLCRGYE